MRAKKTMAVAVGVLAIAFPLAAWGGIGPGVGACPEIPLPQGSEPVKLDPADFTTAIDNPYWPMKPGSRWVYRETAPDGTRQRVVVTVTTKTKLIANGITARVVHDVVREDGELVEVTDDWYAQDCRGQRLVPRRGTRRSTRTARSSRGQGRGRRASTERSRGSLMPADPEVGMTYRQEYYAGEAEDAGAIFSLDEQVGVPAGHFTDVVMTKDTNPLEPRVLEYKFYARGVGPVLAMASRAGATAEDLLSYRRGSGRLDV